jgi:tRNA1Val (adenine37-N6)-methyltransferase
VNGARRRAQGSRQRLKLPDRITVPATAEREDMPDTTTDAFFDGRILVEQYRDGYRFSIDAIILAYHVHPRPEGTILELGTGCGIIPLILAYRHPGVKVVGIEVQPELAELADHNARKNGMQDRIEIFCMDLRDLDTDRVPHPIDMVVTNPPYRKTLSGKINPNPQRAVARHELKATLANVVASAGSLLQTGGKFVTVYTAERAMELLMRMKSGGIEPKSMRSIHSVTNSNAKLILIEGIKDGRPGTKILPPLVVYGPDGNYTPEMKAMFAP